MDFILLKDVIPHGVWVLISFLCALGILACILTAISFFVKSAFDDFNHRRKLIGVAFFLVATAIGGTALVAGHNRSEAEIYNQSAATENLKKKYTLNDVEWLADETTAEPYQTDSYGNLVVVDEQGQRIVFKYKANRETGEPLLSNMPVQGGSVPGVTAESLEK